MIGYLMLDTPIASEFKEGEHLNFSYSNPHTNEHVRLRYKISALEDKIKTIEAKIHLDNN